MRGVAGPNYADADGEALELLAETDPDEATALWTYKEARMRERASRLDGAALVPHKEARMRERGELR